MEFVELFVTITIKNFGVCPKQLKIRTCVKYFAKEFYKRIFKKFSFDTNRINAMKRIFAT